MAMNIIQQQATVKFGLSASTTDVSADTHACTVKFAFEQIERKGTFANTRNTTYAGNHNIDIVLSYDNDGAYTGSTIGALVNQAVIATALAATPGSPVLYFDLVFDSASVGSANRRYTGTCTVLETQRGGEVNTIRTLEVTFPVITITEASV